MKKTILIAALAMPMAVAAQTFNIEVGQVKYSIPATDAGEMLYSAGTTFEMLGRQLQLADITSMYVDDSQPQASTVEVSYAGDKANVTVHGALAQYVDVAVDGAHVSITQSDLVGDDTCGEITYVLSGESTDGQFYMEGSFKATIDLEGLTLTNQSGAPIDIQCGKRIKLSVSTDSENTLTDCADGKQKGCLVCKGHLEIKGHGHLTVNANTAHGIYAKEYIELKNATIDVEGSVKDGLNCNQYFKMESGELNIAGAGDDGVQVSFKDDTDREPEDIGAVIITGGTITAESTAAATKAIKCEGDMTISGGTVTARVSGDGVWDSAKSKTKAAACLGVDGNAVISGGTLNLTATGSGGKGINVDGDLNITGGTIEISTSGGIYAYVNGTEYTNYTGNTDNLDSDAKSSPKGIKADGNVVIDGGEINIVTTGNGAEGIESKSELTINDGLLNLHTTDDAINSSSHMHINGGTITVVATGNDGLDTNGNLYLNGGYVMAFGASSPECGIDANEEGGYSVVFNGGTLLAVGGNNSTPSSSSGSTQPYVSSSSSVSAGTVITLSNGTEQLATFTVPENYVGNSSQGSWGGWGGPGGMGGSNVLITCPGLTSGSSYSLTCGTTTSNVTATTSGSSSGRPW